VGDQNRAGSSFGSPSASTASAAREAARLLAGVAEIGLGAAETALRHARGLLARSDLTELAADLHREVRAHGDVALDRIAPPASAHMEKLARRIVAERAATSASTAGHSTPSESTPEQRTPPLGSYGGFGDFGDFGGA